jgi:hypothetical protein
VRCEAVYDVVRLRWEREQALLGLALNTPDEEIAGGGLAALAIPPTVRICVLPGDPDAVAVPPQDPATVIPQPITVPCGRQLPHHATVRGTSSGYVAVSSAGEDNLWRSFMAVRWHGGVDFFLGDQGGREWHLPPAAFRRRVIYLQTAVCWAWAAFDLQRETAERFTVGGPFRAVVAVAHTSGASLGTFGAGWAEPGSMGFWDQPTAVDQHVLLLEDLAEWPDAAGVEALALRFGARLDLAFGGPGERHLDRTGPDAGKFRPR